MSLLGLPAAALAWLGRQGTRAIAASIFLGIALPQLSASFKPFVPEAIFVLLVLAFLRVEPRALRGYLARPALVASATLWIMVVAPALLGAVFLALGLHQSAPALFMALMFQAASAPIMAAPAFAALMGLDAALALATLLGCVILTPLTAPVFAHLFVGESFSLSPLALGVKLFGLLAGSAVIAWIIRWLVGAEWAAAQKQRIDGLNVITLFVFAVAVMDGVAALLWTRPWFVLGLIALAFAMALGSAALTALLFWRAGKERAIALGWAAANRNMGLMLATTGGVLPDLTWLYFGLAQFPTYLLPMMLQGLARRAFPPDAEHR